MPRDTNPYGDMFGGWLVSQMDLGGSVLAHQCAHNRMTTVAMDSMVFLKPVFVGDTVCCYAKVLKRGTTSVTIGLEAWVLRRENNAFEKVTRGLLTFVAIGEDSRPTPIRWKDAILDD